MPKMVPWVDGIAIGSGGTTKAESPSSLFPNVASSGDDLCVIRSMVGDGVDHGAVLLQLHIGVFSFERPMGAWILCGIGPGERGFAGLHHDQAVSPEIAS